MPLVAVTSSRPGSGKTGVATAVARRFAYAGKDVRLLREPGDEDTFAAADAAWFGAQHYAPGSPVAPTAAAAFDAGENAIVVAEMPHAQAADAAAAVTLLVIRNGDELALPEGAPPTAVVLLGVEGESAGELPGEIDGVPVFCVPEDRILAGFSVSELQASLGAEVINEGDLGDPTCDHLVVAPMGSDAGLPYFDRFRHKAVIARYDRTDMHLAAIRSEPSCLVLSGGRYPSDYVYDAARATGIPVMIAWTDTESTVLALEGLWDRTRFQGERKLDRMSELLDATGLFDTLEIA